MSEATAVLKACAAAGVREFVVCAGARNVELVVGLERSTGCRVWHFFDERSAAFFALGRMLKSGEPAAVVTTSGTAVAELLPATVEAYYQSLPLLLITADRPERFRFSGAPQAIEQEGIFGIYARIFYPGEMPDWKSPAHLNVPLEEPSGETIQRVSGVKFGEQARAPIVGGIYTSLVSDFIKARDGLVVLLGNLGEAERIGLEDFLVQLGVPVWAEAGSGLRERLSGLVVSEIPQDVTKVLRIGGVPSLRFWRDLENLPEIEVVSVSRGGFAGMARESEVVDWVDWAAVEVEPREFSHEALDEIQFEGEPRWFRFLSERIPSGSIVYLGNSLPIREWNSAATFEDRGLRCFSSRGANGIDGQLSTFFGLSADEEESWAIVGDLTAMYDLSAPWVLREMAAAKRRIVVINNGGGKIFSKLPALAGLADGERRAIENDHGVSLEHWAAMWGMSYVRVEREEDFVVEGDSVVVEIFVKGDSCL